MFGSNLLGTPETRRSGRKTLKARSAFTSSDVPLSPLSERMVLITLKERKRKNVSFLIENICEVCNSKRQIEGKL